MGPNGSKREKEYDTSVTTTTIIAAAVSQWLANALSEMLHRVATAIEEEERQSYQEGYDQGYHDAQEQVEDWHKPPV